MMARGSTHDGDAPEQGEATRIAARTSAPTLPTLPTPPDGHGRLCIGIVTADDFDGAWLTLQALRLYHPESVGALVFTILDLNPDGPIASDLRHLSDSVPFVRYTPLRDAHDTAVRDALFHEAETEIVCVLSTPTLLPPGALAALLAWFDTHPAACDPESLDGPDRRALLRWTPSPASPGVSGNAGMCGRWEPEPQRASPVAEGAGAGVFACRREDWSGFSVRLHRLCGTGDEAAVLCPKIQVARQAQVTAAANPFGFFDAIFCLNLDGESRRWREATLRYQTLGIAAQVKRFPAIPTPDNHHRGCALSWRQMVAEASRRDYTHLLVFEDDAVFLDDTLAVVGAAVAELATQEWDLCYLGAAVWAQQFPFVTGSTVLQECGPVTCTHALAVHRRAFARLLVDIPPDGAAFDAWLSRWAAIDQYLCYAIYDGTFRALITSPRVATQRELLAANDTDGALAGRYRI